MFFYVKNGNILKIYKNLVHYPFFVLGLLSPLSYLRSGLKSPVSHLEQFFFPYKQCIFCYEIKDISKLYYLKISVKISNKFLNVFEVCGKNYNSKSSYYRIFFSLTNTIILQYEHKMFSITTVHICNMNTHYT